MKKLITFIITLISFSNASSQWTISETGFSQVYTSISAVDDNTVWTCGHAGIVARTINGGTSWNLSVVGDSLSLVDIYGIDNNNAVVIARDYNPNVSSIWRTSNGGNIWTQVYERSLYLNGIRISSSGSGLCVGDTAGGRWSIIKTTDFGQSWDTAGMYLAGTGYTLDNCLYSDGVSDYWFGASGGKLYHSTNSGSSWTTTTVGSSVIINVYFNGLIGLISSDKKYRSTDGGVTWDTISGHPGIFNQTPAAGIGNKFWQISRGSVDIFYSTDAGVSWSSTYTIDSKFSITVSRTGNSVWITTSNRVLHRSTSTEINTISTQIPDGFSLSQNYPNPFNPSTKIKFAIPNSSFVKLAVYDILGREVALLVDNELNAGTYEYTFEAAEYNSGVYFYKLEADGFVETKKMLLVK